MQVSKVAESYISYYEQYVEYDPLITLLDPANPWISDTVDFWEQDRSEPFLSFPGFTQSCSSCVAV